MNKLLILFFCISLAGCSTINPNKIQDGWYDSVRPIVSDDGKRVGTIYCKKEADGSFFGKTYSLNGNYSGYIKAYLKEGQWWTDMYDANENLFYRHKGISLLFKDLFDFPYQRIE